MGGSWLTVKNTKRQKYEKGQDQKTKWSRQKDEKGQGLFDLTFEGQSPSKVQWEGPRPFSYYITC